MPIRALSSAALLEPSVFGIFRPVLLLPEGIEEHLTAAQLEAIYAHELCYVRRRCTCWWKRCSGFIHWCGGSKGG
jgi:beta-lactamase regulating signal transducer with metallopeptidase domain